MATIRMVLLVLLPPSLGAPLRMRLDEEIVMPPAVLLVVIAFWRLVCWVLAADEPKALGVLTMKLTVAEPYWMLLMVMVLIFWPTAEEICWRKL
jgi:hypothetical protein